MDDVGVFEAKNTLSELLNRVENGEEIAISRRGKVVARLVPAGSVDPVDRRAEAAVAALKRARQGVTLGGLESSALIRSGRR